MSFFQKAYSFAQQLSTELKDNEILQDVSARLQKADPSQSNDSSKANRFGSFAPARENNDAKWFVDGCGYFWAVSEALEQAKETIWILDWWLSPELYLRRPPSQNEHYRLDRMLLAAAERGCKIKVLIYKEVTQALTREYLNPAIPNYLHSLIPASVDQTWQSVARIGLQTAFKSMELIESAYPMVEPPVSVSSVHTQELLESLHQNISVFRHPDHLPDTKSFDSGFMSAIKKFELTAANASKISQDALKTLYSAHMDSVLFWAHHEKLIIVDSKVSFLGGLDLCFGRWDTNQHSIADAHPSNKDRVVWPGQDFNNARIMDFHNIHDWENNRLDRTANPRMAWNDVSLCLSGPIVKDLCTHFVQRHNFIYDGKYKQKGQSRYKRLHLPTSHGVANNQGYHHHGQGLRGLEGEAKDRVNAGVAFLKGDTEAKSQSQPDQDGGVLCQIMRSCAEWSHGIRVEHSIADAYIDAIKNSQHFVYIENQFFITATGESQLPIRNQIGAAIVERVLRAAKSGDRYKIIIILPAIPAFAGDLRNDSSLSTRAVMDFQYKSIHRGGGQSIFEKIRGKGYDPSQYIEFYNLRNYDRINSASVQEKLQKDAEIGGKKGREQHSRKDSTRPGDQEKKSTRKGSQHIVGDVHQPSVEISQDLDELIHGRWDSVVECYMQDGRDIREVPWKGGNLEEIDAYVSEEVYVHSKLMIVDDRICILGSANLNDRSQLGYHDSEIAVVVEDSEQVDSQMNSTPWRASKFAASLRRHIFRKHLGLLHPQDFTDPDDNFRPVGIPNAYDWGSPEDKTVSDPLSASFEELWRSRAKNNTKAFEQVFRAIPSDKVRNWKDYEEHYGRFSHEDTKEGKKLSLYKWGHVVAEDFAEGDEGLKQVKDVLATIKGTLVQMPLHFLEEEEIAKQGMALNAFTAEIYT